MTFTRNTIVASVLLAASLAAVSAAQVSGRAGSQRIGEFTIRNYARFATTFGANRIDADLTGSNLQLSSDAYDMAAPKITLTARKASASAPYRVTHADATGGVRIVVRRREAQQTTTVTSDKAVYSATADPKEPGRIRLTGNVKSVTEDPGFAEPLVQTAESGIIELLGPDETRVELLNGNLSVTPREPAPKPPAGKPKATPRP